jgi:hypothetical protein
MEALYFLDSAEPGKAPEGRCNPSVFFHCLHSGDDRPEEKFL